MSFPILIVDDSQTVRMDLVGLLEGAGMSCVTCGTVTEAVSYTHLTLPTNREV